MAEVHVGCSGFNYPHWKGTFYPDPLPQRKWLKHYCSVFSSVELNVTFYRLLNPATFTRWYGETPDGFTFAVKGSRFITHVRRLLDPGEPVDLFFNGVLSLQDKLRVVLWQFPPSFRRDVDRLERFLAVLDGYPALNTFEFRDESWINEDVISLCREHAAGLCVADRPPFAGERPVTADFVYLRRHGRGGRDACYTSADLRNDAKRIRKYLKDGNEVFIYFNNDADACAPANAAELRSLLH